MKSSRDGQPKAGTATTAALHGDLDQPKREERPLVSDTETDTKKKTHQRGQQFTIRDDGKMGIWQEKMGFIDEGKVFMGKLVYN